MRAAVPLEQRTEEALVPSDADIRPALRSVLASEHAAEPETRIIEELGVCRGQVRVDMAIVNGAFHGYEIKSDRDSLRRLRTQVDFYGRVLDRATLVVGERHLAEALGLLPTWWGVLSFRVAADGLRFESVRPGEVNAARDPRALVELLWLQDALALLESRDAARGVRTKAKRFVWDRVCACFTVDEIADAVRAQLKARAATQGSAGPS